MRKIIHMGVKRRGVVRYLCNTACNVTPSKITAMKTKVTCKNCKKETRKWL